MYEAASIDGASQWQKIRYLTIPSLVPTMMIMVLLAIGNIFRGDFGLFYQTVKSSALLQPYTDVIDTYVFRLLIDLSLIHIWCAWRCTLPNVQKSLIRPGSEKDTAKTKGVHCEVESEGR